MAVKERRKADKTKNRLLGNTTPS